MSFKENLLQKINIDKMAKQVIASIGPAESGRKVDKKTMRNLLEMAAYTFRRKRDLDLFIEDVDTEKTRILVLDNDLAIYHTTVYDVAMRKTPTVKEMMNPFNVIKILKDTDVVISKKEESVKTIQKECIDRLDLSYNESDLDEIAGDGAASLEREYADGVIESIDLFAEILGYRTPPKAFRISHHKIIGALRQKESGEVLFGPMVLYSMMHNSLKLIEQQTGSFDREKIEFIQDVVTGKTQASSEGPLVFEYLKKTALSQNRVF
jgi:tRNA uridine 5-carbamoylmethylation protein Kti12